MRRRILSALVVEAGSAESLSLRLGESLSYISYHLNRVLDEGCGVIELVSADQRPGSEERTYTLKGDVFAGMTSNSDIPASLRSALTGLSLGEFLAVVNASIESEAFELQDHSVFEWSAARVDREAWLEFCEASMQFRERVKAATDRCQARRPANSEELQSVVIGIAAVQTPGPLHIDEG
ncbi:MAG TPA: hypothetical protein VGO36_07950 [Solirubrobacterales bacterium]|nr:hypothetical protein [Solirubrobacterales bacterium]